MRKLLFRKWIFTCLVSASIVSCAHVHNGEYGGYAYDGRFDVDYASRLPQQVDTNGKKLVLVDPNVHAWGAYAADGHLVRAGIATAGGAVCPPDADESDCRTGIGTFHVSSMQGEGCYSKIYPRPHGGGLMPYCMFFHNGQALHGAPDEIVVAANISHGCVRMRIPDAEWMQNNFVQVGTTVKVVPYEE